MAGDGRSKVLLGKVMVGGSKVGDLIEGEVSWFDEDFGVVFRVSFSQRAVCFKLIKVLSSEAWIVLKQLSMES